ncbi:DeoR family transcriptional regulator [Anaerococcus hydrogenalis]|nr:DeoR family transcriptional regulator [Anaerococcus hydrogenalis]
MKLNKMFLEERLKFIESKLNKDYRVNVSDLADDLKVSEVTIRKDLKELEEKNIAKRTHGGAIKIQKNIKELAVDNKKTINIDLKKIYSLKGK